ncbi:MAG: proline racemase [Ignavibacteria bacterium]|nr:proline racemase [Ignavibacteria bacterium]
MNDRDITRMRSWNPPSHWLRIATLDAHTGGEPLRIVIDGFPELNGSTILEKRRDAQLRYDHLRKAIMLEPRGHRDMYGCIIVPPVAPGSDFGVLFTHAEGYSTMCGHGIIAVSMVAVKTGLVSPTEPETMIRIDTPAGLVRSSVHVRDGMIGSVSFANVPSFVVTLDEIVAVPGLGDVRFDLAFGGAYYAYVAASDVGLRCDSQETDLLIRHGMAIKRAIMDQRTITHPIDADLGFLYGTIFVAASHDPAVHSRNVCIFADGQVDRSPTGTGVSGRLAIHFKKGELKQHEPIVVESITGSRFTGWVEEIGNVGSFDAVVPRIEGNAFITGRHEFLVDPNDPLRNGFLLQ